MLWHPYSIYGRKTYNRRKKKKEKPKKQKKEKPITASPHAMLKRDEHKNLSNLSTSLATSQLFTPPYEVEPHSSV